MQWLWLWLSSHVNPQAAWAAPERAGPAHPPSRAGKVFAHLKICILSENEEATNSPDPRNTPQCCWAHRITALLGAGQWEGCSCPWWPWNHHGTWAKDTWGKAMGSREGISSSPGPLPKSHPSPHGALCHQCNTDPSSPLGWLGKYS